MRTLTTVREWPLNHWINGAVFMMGALALVLPSGYSIGPLLLVCLSVTLLTRFTSIPLSAHDGLVVAALMTYGLVVGGLAIGDLGLKGLDKPLRFMLAVPVLLLLLRHPPCLAWLWAGIACGAVGAGCFALWLRLIEGVARSGGFLHVIQFGNLSMLMGVLCVAGLGWALIQRCRSWWVVLLASGAVMGVLGSLLSGSRGGWVGLPVIVYVLYKGYGRQLSSNVRLAAMAILASSAMTLYLIPQVGIHERIQAAVNDVAQYASGDERNTSLGLRFEMWRGAAQLIHERPLLGWGDVGYRSAMIELAAEGEIIPEASEFDHAHNEYLDALAKRGIVGLLALLGLYLVPLKMFASGLNSGDLRLRSLAMAGTLLPVAYMDFGLSQTFMAHNSGVMFYAFWLALLWGCFSAYRRAGLASSGPGSL